MVQVIVRNVKQNGTFKCNWGFHSEYNIINRTVHLHKITVSRIFLVIRAWIW